MKTTNPTTPARSAEAARGDSLGAGEGAVRDLAGGAVPVRMPMDPRQHARGGRRRYPQRRGTAGKEIRPGARRFHGLERLQDHAAHQPACMIPPPCPTPFRIPPAPARRSPRRPLPLRWPNVPRISAPLGSLKPLDTLVTKVVDTAKGVVEAVHTTVKDSIRKVDSTVFVPVDSAHPDAPRGVMQVAGKSLWRTPRCGRPTASRTRTGTDSWSRVPAR